MLKYFLRRLLAMIPKLIIISLVVFFALQLLPGDAVTRSVSPDVYRNMTPEQLDALRESLGLNDPLLVQYLRWVRNILRGEFGYSQATGANIAGMLAARLPATIELTFWALVVANVLGLLLGVVAALSGIVMAVCTLKGYELLGGKLTKKGVVISVLVMLLMVYVGDRCDWAIVVAREMEADFFTSFRAVPALMDMDIIDTGVYMSSLLRVYLFTLVGAVPMILSLTKGKSRKNETYAMK